MAFFGLLSDLDQSKWHDSPTNPPPNKKEMAGGTYAAYGIINTQQKADHIRYFLSHDNGTSRAGLLYAVKNDPMKGVGHAWFTFGEGNVIKGMAIEDDWVCINEDFFSTITPPPEKEEVIQRQETVDMGIYGDLKHGKWTKKEKAPRGKGKLGYHRFDILKSAELQGDKSGYEVYLSSDPKGDQSRASIFETSRNPFRQITNCFLKIVEENGVNVIKGVMVEDDWVEKVE